MKSLRLSSAFVVASALAFLLLTAAHAEDAPTTIKFSDPGKPGTVKIAFARGDLQITAADTSEVSVRAANKPATQKARKDGLRVLTTASSFALSEKENVITLDAASDNWGKGAGDLKLTVPRNTSIIVQSTWGGGGDITCTGIGGDIEINSLNGQIRLNEIAGGVVVSTVNGEIRANVRELRENKSLSFISVNGEVELRVPDATKANLRFRTQNGSVATDFEEPALATKIENSPRPIGHSAPRRVAMTIGNKSAWIAEKPDAEESADRTKPKNDAERLSADLKRAADADRKRADEHKAVANGLTVTTANPDARPFPTFPPIPPAVPTITGGSLVTGTLNGGGAEISISTMNGDVLLRKLEKK